MAMNKAMLPNLSIAFLLSASVCIAQSRSPDQQMVSKFITLGTQGGPNVDPKRSQPANLLRVGQEPVVIDAGDGTAERLAQAGVNVSSVRTIFLSHLHLDHTAGMQALIGLRWMTNAPGMLTVYGPPGTDALVSGLLASMAPAQAAGFGYPGSSMPDAAAGIRVVELRGDLPVLLPWGKIRAVRNSHYSFAHDTPEAEKNVSLSYRFELPDRVIVYTGDTGESDAVATLAKGADLLVSEVIDLDYFYAHPPFAPGTPDAVRNGVMRHLEEHHLTPAQVGRIASAAHVAKVVLTHLSGCEDQANPTRCISGVRAAYSGPVEQAEDLKVF